MIRAVRVAAVVAGLGLAIAASFAPPARAEVARSVPVMAPGLPIALGTADVWPAPQGANGAVVLLPDAAAAPAGLASELAARGHVVAAYTARPWPEPERAERLATALRELPQVIGRGGEAAVLVTDSPGLGSVLDALARSGAPPVRAIVVDGRAPLGRVELPAADAIADWPPLLVLLDEAIEAQPAEVVRLLLAWRARGGDAQQAAIGAPGQGLVAVVDDYVRSRMVRRVPRFESAVLVPDGDFARARAALVPAARRIVGIAAGSTGLRIGLDGPSARVLVADGDAWRLDADFGRQRLVHFGPAQGSEAAGTAIHAATVVGERVLLRRHDPGLDLWRPVAEWSVGAATVERVELHARADGSLLAVVDDGRLLRAWRIDAGDVQPVSPPPGRLDAIATGHGVLAALTSAGARQSLWLDAFGEWRAVAGWPRAPGAPMRALMAAPAGGWLAFGTDGSNLRVDPVAGVALELDAGATLGTLAEASPSVPAPVAVVHPETGDVLSWRAAGWSLDGASLMLWRESSGRHALSAAPGLAHLDAALPIDADGFPGAGILIAGRDASGRVRLLRGTLPGIRPPGGWWQADEAVQGGVWLAHGSGESDLHRLDRESDGGSRWRVARARFDGPTLVAEGPWTDPFTGSAPTDAPAAGGGAAPLPRMDFDPARVAEVCGPPRAGIAAAVLDGGSEALCLRTGKLPATPQGRRTRGVWRQSAAEWPAMVGLSDAGPASSARDAVVLLYRDGEGAARWRFGVADPVDGMGIAALSEWRLDAAPAPSGLLVYRADTDCGDAPLLVEWRPFADAGRLPGLPRGLGARFVRADLPACY